MKELVEFIVKSLVDSPDQVDVQEFDERSTTIVEVSVAQPDMGRVIGKGGRVANAMRVLLRVAAAHEGKQVTLHVVEPE